jgi:AraC family transcriptional regulator, alkane utilization regulator
MIDTPASFADRPQLDENAQNLLGELLRGVRLTGSVFMDACLSAPFDMVVPPKFDPASPLGRLRHISIFHLVAGGGCEISVIGSPPMKLASGDIILIPLGLEHRIWAGRATPSTLEDQFRQGPLQGTWTITYGGGGHETHFVCGWIESSEFLFLPMFRSLPPYIIESLGREGVSAAITSTVGSILTLAKQAVPGTELALGRMMEALFVEVLRRYAARLPEAKTGWFAALRDPIVSRAMQLVHKDAARRWTVEALARAAGTSRSVLAERFQEVMGRAPIDYVTNWRMQIAAERIRSGRESLASIAAEVGYESEAAFARAFKRVTGTTPGQWRDGRPA